MAVFQLADVEKVFCVCDRVCDGAELCGYLSFYLLMSSHSKASATCTHTVTYRPTEPPEAVARCLPEGS